MNQTLTGRTVSLAKAAFTLLLALTVMGCSGLTQLQDSLSKFSQGAHSVSTAESGFFRAVRVADCNNQFYTQANMWALGQAKKFDITGACTPTVLTDDQVQRRLVLMATISLYADQLAALATTDNDKSLDTNSQSLATEINTLAKQGGVKNLSVESAVESAVIAMTTMVIDWKVQSDVKATAGKFEQQLTTIVTALKAENTNYASGIESKIGAVESNLRPVVAESPRNNSAARFSSLLQARAALQAANPFGPMPLAASPGGIDPSLVPTTAAAQLNVALDGLVMANHAIANSGTGGIVAAVNGLLARAQAAQAMQVSLNK